MIDHLIIVIISLFKLSRNLDTRHTFTSVTITYLLQYYRLWEMVDSGTYFKTYYVLPTDVTCTVTLFSFTCSNDAHYLPVRIQSS